VVLMAASTRQTLERTRYPGVYRVHRRGCPWTPGKPCRCPASYQASVYSARERKSIRKHFDNQGAARTWREDVSKAVREGKIRTPTKTTLDQAATALIAGMRSGAIFDRSGKPYKPSTIRSYERVLRLRVLPELGHRRLGSLERRDVQRLVERMHGAGLAASTIQNTLNPLQVICRRAVHDGDLAIDPTEGLLLPAVRGRRDRVASREEAATLIAALPESERALWACAFYAGLRRGELRALRWSAIDLASTPAAIHVRRTWDDEDGEVSVKTDAGYRAVPLIGRLRDAIVEHGLATRRSGADLVFGRTAQDPFIPSTVRARAMKAWGWKQVLNPKDEGPRTVWVKAREDALVPLTPHEARHCAASYLIEAGLNDLELTAVIGHSDSRTTKAIYGHLFPDSCATIAAKLEAYHEQAA
jgi:integrase